MATQRAFQGAPDQADMAALLAEAARRRESRPSPAVFAPLERKSRHKWARGGRGSGKSRYFARKLVRLAARSAGLRWLCVREIQLTLADSVKQLLEDEIGREGLGSKFGVTERWITTPGGGKIAFVGMREHTKDSVKSLEGFDGAWVEEAHSLSQGSLDILRPTIRKPGSELWFSWNPRSPKDPVDAFFRGGDAPGFVPPPDTIGVEANWSDNPYFEDSPLYADMLYDRRRDPDKFAHVWQGEYERHSEARVYSNWREADFDCPPSAKLLGGADWGFADDPTAAGLLWLEGRELFVWDEAWALRLPIDKTPAAFDRVGCRECQRRGGDCGGAPGPRGAHASFRSVPVMADSARPETIDYMRSHGYPLMDGAKKGPGSVEDGIEWLKSVDVVVHPRCRRTIDELRSYKYRTDAHTGAVTADVVDANNHVMDLLRYATEPLRRRKARAGLVF